MCVKSTNVPGRKPEASDARLGTSSVDVFIGELGAPTRAPREQNTPCCGYVGLYRQYRPRPDAGRLLQASQADMAGGGGLRGEEGRRVGMSMWVS